MMTSRTLRLAAGLGGLLATAAFGAGLVQGALAQSQQTPAAVSDAAPTLTMEQVLAQLRDQGYGEIDEIERERDRFEVKARDREGRRVELYLDARTGETLKSERKDKDD
jgi:uncharacterized membrane protein YkoI